MLTQFKWPSDSLAEFLPRHLSSPRFSYPQIEAQFVPRDNLFVRIARLLSDGGERTPGEPELALEALCPLVAFRLSPVLAITVNRHSVKPSLVQCFLTAMLKQVPRGSTCVRNGELIPTTIDPGAELTLWMTDLTNYYAIVEKTWNEIKTGGIIESMEALTTPKLYGSKERLTNFLFGVAVATLPPGAPVLDLMSGTGIVARTLAHRHHVTANDANPYSALLTGTQGISLHTKAVEEVMRSLMPPFEANLSALTDLVKDSLEAEAAFLHCEHDVNTLQDYAAFCSEPVLPIEPHAPPIGSPHRLCTARYSNAYFGIEQATEIDSMRAAIELMFPDSGPTRDICLAALIIAVCICNSGPHFAQPRKITSLRALKDIIERRARSVLWEFDVALRRLAARPPLPIPLGPVTQLDWREALDGFVSRLNNLRPAAVYVDPPYSKLQYSRYYHVLNVLIANDYPPVEGSGRYPPRSQRFSSRFEYQPRTAEREFRDLFGRCSRARLNLIVSYGDRGFLPVSSLAEMMLSQYGNLHILSERIRHHSQGVPLSAPEGKITEYVFVGAP